MGNLEPMILREYQQRCHAAIFEAWKKFNSTLIVLPTGAGKTIVFAHVIKSMAPKRAMVLAHRNELIVQAREKIMAVTGFDVEIEKAELYASQSLYSKMPVVVSSIQTQISGPKDKRRYLRFNPMDFGVLIADEAHHCFPHDTKVLTNIGWMTIGDIVENKKKLLVSSVNLLNDAVEWKPITRWFKVQKQPLLKITHECGHFYCSGNHKIWTTRGYERAENLIPGMGLRVVRDSVQANDKFLETASFLQCEMPWKTHGFKPQNTRQALGQKQKANGCKIVRLVPRTILETISRKVQRGAEVLLTLVRQKNGHFQAGMESICTNQYSENAQSCKGNEAARNQCSNESQESYGESRYRGESKPRSFWKNIFGAWWQWEADQASGDFVRTFTLANGTPCFNVGGERQIPIASNLLQGGYCEHRKADSGRSRWQFPQAKKMEVFRSKENRDTQCSRVVGVEVVKRGSDGESKSGYGKSDFLYDIEVAMNHNYFADGVLVSNSTSNSWKEVIAHYRKNPDLKVLGVTATSDRGDGEALGQVFESVAFEYGILDAIHDGYLVDITQQFVPVSSLDFSHIRTTAGDLNEGDLSKVMEMEENIQGVCQPSIEVMYGLPPKTLSSVPVPQWREYLAGLNKVPRRTIVFTVSVAQAEMCANIFGRAMDGVEWVCGATNHVKREAILDRFSKGETHVVVNCGVLLEGFDNPGVEVIVMARPTKSRSLYCQAIGRSTRPLPGLVDGIESAAERRAAIATSKKPFCRVLDFVGNSGRHKLVSCTDVLGGHISEEAREMAKEKAIKEGKPVKIMVTMDNAELELERKRQEAAEKARREREARKNHLLAKVDYRMQDVDPFGQSERIPLDRRMSRDGRQFSEKQAAVLRRAGYDPARFGYKQGQAVIGKVIEGWKKKKEFSHA